MQPDDVGMALELTLDECIRVNKDLTKAAQSNDFGTLKNILSSLQASDVRGKLKVRPPSARARTTPPCAEPVRMGARRARSFWPSPSSAKLSISCANSKPTAT